MYLMIVEDEPRLRNNLALEIPWEDHGIEVIGLAESGEEALKLFDRKKPDIMLLDVQMSGMSGLELAKLVRLKNPYIKMIVLSGHDNFEFAQIAMETGISKYLLKPAGDSEILNAVLESAAELREQLDALHNQTLLTQKWTQHLPHLRELFLMNWLQGKYSLWEIEKHSSDMMMDLDTPRLYCVAIVDMDPLQAAETRFRADDTSLLQVSLKYIASQDLKPEWMFLDSNGSTVIVFHTCSVEDPEPFILYVNATIGKLLNIVKESLKLTASAGISEYTDQVIDMNKLYEQARQALQRRIVYGKHIAISYQARFEQDMLDLGQPNSERELEIGIETGNLAKALEAFDKQWNSLMLEADTMDKVNEIILYFGSLIVRLIQQRGCSVKEVAGSDFPYLLHLQSFATKEQVYECLQRIIHHFITYQHARRGSAGHRMVEAALQIIDDGIQEDLTLYNVAERLFINSSYLSRLFKQETGKSFSAYVLEHKMERAKSILIKGAKVYDTASAVGYRDLSYFTKVFRKYWGVTPGEFSKLEAN